MYENRMNIDCNYIQTNYQLTQIVFCATTDSTSTTAAASATPKATTKLQQEQQ